MYKKKPKFKNNLSFVFHALKRKPFVLIAAVRFVLKRTLGLKGVRGMDIAISYRCNLSCDHCNIALQVNSDRNEMTDADIVSAIVQLKNQGGFYVTFTGGEPLLFLKRIERITSIIGRNKMLWQVQTNGTLLNDHTLLTLKKAGIDNVQISFDTFHEETDWNNLISLKKKQIHQIRSFGMDVFFTFLSSHSTVNNGMLDAVAEFSDQYNVKIGLNFAVPQGNWFHQHEELLKSKDSQIVRKIAAKHPYLYTDLHNNLFQFGCPAFKERFHINAYGDVQPCTFFQISFGNIKYELLSSIIDKALKNDLFKTFPDHCPPAENKAYIKKWMKKSKSATALPIPFNDYFETETKTDNGFSTCIVCGGNKGKLFIKDAGEMEYGLDITVNLYQCTVCDLIQQVPMLTQEIAVSNYPTSYIHYNPQPHGLKGFLMMLYMGRTVRLLQKHGVSTGAKLLDIGCGAGEKLAIIRDRLNLHVTGIEPDERAAHKAIELFGLTVINGFFHPKNFRKHSFDVVRINHVIEHVPDPVAFINGIYSVLKPGGLLIGETENIDSISYRVFQKYWALLHLPYHLTLFSRETLSYLVSQTAFKNSPFYDQIMKGDPPSWSLSFQNYLLRNIAFSNRKSSRIKGYLLLTLLSVPLTTLETVIGKGPVIEFVARK